VSEAWKLPRRQRAVIDIGGVYFESMFLLLLLGLHLYTGNAIYLFGFLFIDISIATTFNPFLRMDGYWLMSDLFGIVNLRKQQILWLSGLLARWSGRAAPQPSGLNKRARQVLSIYTVLGLLFIGYLLKVVYQVVILNILAGYPDTLKGFWAKLQGGMAALDIAGGLLEIVWRTLVIMGAAMMLWSLLRGLIDLIARVRSIRAAAVAEGA
jgi:putative peptide zinc metalloprotease protein